MNGYQLQRLREIESEQVKAYREFAANPCPETIDRLVLLRRQENKIRGTNDEIDIERYYSFHPRSNVRSNRTYANRLASIRKRP